MFLPTMPDDNLEEAMAGMRGQRGKWYGKYNFVATVQYFCTGRDKNKNIFSFFSLLF